MTARAKGYFRFALIIAVFAILFNATQPAHAQSFDSGSNGSDGALNLTTPGTIEFDPTSFSPPLDPDGDNIYHFTTINIASGVTVRLTAKRLNAPVFWLASGTVQIDGIIDLNGERGQTLQEIIQSGSPFPSMPGAGGYPGGVAPFGGPAQPGSGPGGGRVSGASDNGGGAGHATTGDSSLGGAAYGNPFLVPLLGGSGGGGGVNSTGGAGGGALLIASSASITVNGTIMANGAPNSFGNGGGGGGSGGAIRLVAPTIGGTGMIHAEGNPTSAGNGGSAGRIRLEAFQRNFTGSTNPTGVVASPFALFLPTTPAPSVRVVSVDGQSVPPNPTGSFTVPDVSINKSTAVTVDIAASNIPPGTVVKLHVFSENGADQIIDSLPLAGTLATSTATASVVLPPGFSRGFVRATWATQ